MARLTDGHPTTISLGGGVFFEISVTPPGMDGGGPNDTTTMRNLLWRSRQPKKLITLTEAEITAAYDTDAYDTILDQLNVNQEIQITFSDESILAFWGWLNTFRPNEHREGEQPTVSIQIVPSNQDNEGVEIAPVFQSAA